LAVPARLARAAGVAADERGLIALVALIFASLEAGRGIGDVGVNTLVLSRLTADALPALYAVLGLVSLVVALAFGAAIARVRRARLFGATLATIAVLLLVERLVLASGSVVALSVAWLTVAASGAIGATIAWTAAASTFDARQAKRLFPLCTAGAIVGNFAGGLAAGPVAAALGTESLIVVQAGLLLLAAALITRLGRRATSAGWSAPRRTGRHSIAADVRIGFDAVRASPLMRLVSVAYVLFAVLLFSVNFAFYRAARAQFRTEVELATALGVITAIVTSISLVVSLFVANRVYARFGVAFAALLLPVVYVAGFAVWIVQFSFLTAAAFTGAQQVTQRGLSNAAWSAFYNVVPSARRAQVLAFQDGVPGQLGTVLVGVLLLTAGRVLAPDQLYWLALPTAIALTIVAIGIRRRYAASLVGSLRAGAGEQVLEGGPAIADLVATAEVRAALVAALGEPDPRLRALAATLLAGAAAPEAHAALERALGDPDPGVRGAAAGAILASAHRGQSADRADAVVATLLAGDEAERVAGAGAMARSGHPVAPDTVARLTGDPSADVRAATMAMLRDSTAATTSTIVAGLDDPAAVVRRAAAERLATLPAVPDGVLEVLRDGSPESQAAALMAMDGHGSEVRAIVAPWAETQIARALRLADAERRLPIDSADPVLALLRDVLARRVERAEGLALAAMSALGARDVRGVIRRNLRSADPDVRAQAIEALDSIGDRRVGGALARLVEQHAGAPDASLDQVLGILRGDNDPWIRGLARRIATPGGQMTEAAAPLDALETMLQLRRVPLFERLDPEDLRRLASVATERRFEPGSTIVREGDLGDELFVIVEGGVRVSRSEADGGERRLREYGPGDHIGELAVLRQRPRAATVTAGTDGVRLLVIDGDGLKAILRERPDAAMAMLATLAERISAQ
jgi:HEAT repeat protein